MARITKKIGWVLGLVLLAALSACGGSEQAAAPVAGGATSTDIKVYEDSPYLTLDGSQDQILMFNMELTRRLTFFEKLKDAVFADEKRESWLEDLEKHLGFNAIKEIDRIVIGMKEPFDRDDWLKNAVIVMVCDYGSPSTFAQGFVNFANGRYVNTTDPPVSSDYRKVPIYSMLGSSSLENPDEKLEYHLAFPGKRIVVFSRQLAMITPILDVIQGTRPNLQTRPDWQRRLTGARFSSVALGLGKIPQSIQDWLKEKVASDPEYKGLIYMGDGREFYFSFAYTGRDYELSASLRCDEISRAQGLRSNLEEFRKRGLDSKAIGEWLDQDTSRTAILKKLTDQITISIQSQAAVLDVKKSTAEMDRFVDELIKPPPVAPVETEKPATPAESGSDDPFSQ